MTEDAEALQYPSKINVVDASYADMTKVWLLALQKSIPLRMEGDQLSSYASSLGKLFDCPRRCYWDRVDAIPDHSTKYFADASLGDMCHEWAVDVYKRAGLWRASEVRGSHQGCNLSYRIDVLIEEPFSGEIVPVEIKSQHRDKYEETVARGRPLEDHELQLQCYMHFNRPLPFEWGLMHYICRNRAESTLFRVMYNPKVGEAIQSSRLQLEKDIANHALPPTGGQDCWFCTYKKRCKETKA